MKYLFTIHPMFGHFHSVVPLAQTLKDHGHEVAFATGKSFGPVVQRVGFQHFSCGLDFDGSKNIFETLPEVIKQKQCSEGEKQLYGFIQALAPKMADDLIRLVKYWEPDVIIRDPVEFGGYIAAEYYGLPHVSIMWAMYISAKHLCADTLIELRRSYKLSDDPGLDTLDKYLVLDFLPASWMFPNSFLPLVTHRFCAPPFDLSYDLGLPEWINTLPDQPTVYATLGTTFNQAPETVKAIITALKAEDLNLIITIGRSMNPMEFGPQPENIKIEQYIPQSMLLPRCDAIIFHGGYNSLLSSLWNGLPMVITPLGAGDQFPTGVRCSEMGIGILVDGVPPEPETICGAVKTILSEPAYRMRARQLQQDIKALPSLSEAVKRLELLARAREPQISTTELLHISEQTGQ